MKIATTSQDTRKGKGSNDYGVVVVKEKKGTVVVVKNYQKVGTFMASDRGLFRQLPSQEKEIVATFDDGIAIAEQWLEDIEQEINAKLEKVADELYNQAAAKNYKSGWAFYKMKDFYGYDLAKKFGRRSD